MRADNFSMYLEAEGNDKTYRAPDEVRYQI